MLQIRTSTGFMKRTPSPARRSQGTSVCCFALFVNEPQFENYHAWAALKNRTMTDSAFDDITSDFTHEITLEIGR